MKRFLALAAAFSVSPLAQAQDFSDQQVSDHIREGRYGSVTSLLILHGGNITYEGYFRGTDSATRHDTRSVSKTITGMAAGLAIADGAIELETPIAQIFTDAMPFEDDDPRKHAITVFDLLTMTGPMECNDWEHFSRGNEERMYMVDDWISFYWDLPIRADRPWETPASDRPHGRAFSYCTTGVQVLSEAIARRVGMPLDDYLQERLFDPLEIEQPEWQRLAGRDAFAGGGMRLTTWELARLAELYRAGGVQNGQHLLPEDWIDRSLAEYAVIPDRENTGYGFLWWRREYESGGQSFLSWEMAGNGGNRVLIIPALDVVAVITKTDFNTPGMHEATDSLIEAEIVGHFASAH